MRQQQVFTEEQKVKRRESTRLWRLKRLKEDPEFDKKRSAKRTRKPLTNSQKAKRSANSKTYHDKKFKNDPEVYKKRI